MSNTAKRLNEESKARIQAKADELFEKWSKQALIEFDERTDSLTQTRKEYNDRLKAAGIKKTKSKYVKAPFFKQGVFEKTDS